MSDAGASSLAGGRDRQGSSSQLMIYSSLARIVDEASQRLWVVIYLRMLACVLLYGATVHIGNMMGLGGRPWLQTPLLWRSLDVVLLLFNLVVGMGLWRKAAWAVIAFVLGIVLLQILPYTLLRAQFIQTSADAQVLNQLVGTEVLLILGLMIAIAVAYHLGASAR